MKRFLLILFILGMFIAPFSSFAQQTTNDFEIIPEAASGGNVTQAVQAVGKT